MPAEAAPFDLDRHLQGAGALSRDGGEGDGGHRHGIGPPVRMDCRPARSVAPCPGAHPRRGRVRAPHGAPRRVRGLGWRQLECVTTAVSRRRRLTSRRRRRRPSSPRRRRRSPRRRCRSAQPGCRVLRARPVPGRRGRAHGRAGARSPCSIRGSTAPRRASRRRPMTYEPGCRPPRRPRSGQPSRRSTCMLRGSRPPIPTAVRIRSSCSAPASPATGCSRRS